MTLEATATLPDPAPAEDRGDVYVPPNDLDEPDADALAAVLAGASAATPIPTPAPAPEPGDKHEGGIPKARFNEVNEEKKRLARELEEAQAEVQRLRTAAPVATPAPTPAPPAFDEDAKESEYTEALMEGDTKKAVAIRKEINAHVRATAKSEAAAEAESRYTQREQEAAAQTTARDLSAASAQAVADFPYLDTEAGGEALELIVASRDRKIAQGIAHGEALRQAVKVIAPKFDPNPKAADPAEPKDDQRAAEAVKRGAADSLQQPASVQAGVGNRATAGRVNVQAMTDAEFDALPMAERRRLRGDAG